MDALGINLGLLLSQAIIPILWFVFTGICLVDLARKKLTGTPLALWVLIICAIPILGGVAYCIVRPTAEGNV